MISLVAGRPLKLYISAFDLMTGNMLAQEDEQGNKKVIYYLSRMPNKVETRYSPIEKLCLSLYHSYTKLKYYLMPFHVLVVLQTDIFKYMLSKPMIHGRIGKWMIALIEFSLQYVPAKVVKGRVLAYFLIEHPNIELQPVETKFVGLKPVSYI